MSEAGRPPRGSFAVQDDDRRKKGFPWWLILALVALVLLALLLLSQCGDDEEDSTAGSDPTGTTTSSSAMSPSAGASSSASGSATGATAAATGGSGTLTAGGQVVLPATGGGALNGSLSRYDGQDAVANGVEVQSVPADEGFWVGTSETDRVWVQLVGQAGESAYQVRAGDLVDFEGTMKSHAAGFAAEVGVTDDEGAQQLSAQQEHVEVAMGSVQLSKR